jgi:predicted DNA-binding protein
MTTQMIIRVDPEIKDKIGKLARREGKTTSQIVREMMEEYVKEHDISTYIDDLWGRVGGKLSKKGTTIKDIERSISEVRAGKK